MGIDDLDLSTLIRYFIPGSIAILPILIFYAFHDSRKTSIISLALILAIPVGYFVHQIWLLFFRITGMKGNGYCREKRENIKILSDKIKEDKRYKTIQNKFDKLSEKEKETLITKLACLAWESWEYKDTHNAISHRKHTRRLWTLYHGNISIGISGIIGMVLPAMFGFYKNNLITYIFFIIYIFILLNSFFEAHELYKEVNMWESMMLFINYDKSSNASQEGEKNNVIAEMVDYAYSFINSDLEEIIFLVCGIDKRNA